MKTRERFWIIDGISSAKIYIANCGKCALLKAKPVRQLKADLPSCQVIHFIHSFILFILDHHNNSKCMVTQL